MVKIKWQELVNIAETLKELNEVISVDKQSHYKLYYKNFTAEASKEGSNFVDDFYSNTNQPSRFFPPFKSKVLPDKTKLFRRKFGVKETILANSEKNIIFTCPYPRAKINKLEVIDANKRDRVDLVVKSPDDPLIASSYGLPADTLLNQFGFDVVVCDLLYSDKSEYDADVFQGFQIVVTYKNDSLNDKEVGFNIIFHEVVD